MADNFNKVVKIIRHSIAHVIIPNCLREVQGSQKASTAGVRYLASSATLALKAGLCFLRSLEISRSSSTALAIISCGLVGPLSFSELFLIEIGILCRATRRTALGGIL